MVNDKSPIQSPKSRYINKTTSLFLYARAGGRCEFCNEYLLEHPTSGIPGNFAEKAHIFGFKEKSARGNERGKPKGSAINKVDNLILLCPPCHHLIDNVEPENHSVEDLKKLKSTHEARVYDQTGISENLRSIPLVIKSLIAGRVVDVSSWEMQEAAKPHYLMMRDRVDVDLTRIPDSPDEHYWQTASKAINREMDRLDRLLDAAGKPTRISVFGLGSIPLLVYIGTKLSDKREVGLHQRHRDPESWCWKEGEGSTQYTTTCISDMQAEDQVALLVNLSGKNTMDTVLNTEGILKNTTIYELTLDGQQPNTMIMNTRGDLERFTAEYNKALAIIRENHTKASCLHLFPAVPAPVAITLGRSRLPKADLPLVVYDYNRQTDGFVRTMEISHDT